MVSNSKFKNNNSKKNLEGYNPRMYLQMKVIYVLLSIATIVVVLFSFYNLGWGMYCAQQSYKAIAKVDHCFMEIGSNVLRIVDESTTFTIKADAEGVNSHSEVSNEIANYENDIEELFEEIDDEISNYSSIKILDERVKNEFYDAIDSVNEVKNKLKDLSSDNQGVIIEQVYENELKLLMEKTNEKISLALTDQEAATLTTFHTKAKSVVYILAIMIFIIIVGVFAITMMDRLAKRAALELQKRAMEIEETSRKLNQSRNKTKAIAFTSILTGMKNRYSLEEDLGARLGFDNFYIANFEYDNFRYFTEVYGRDFGDEFISLVAENLKKEFAEYAEIYNITNEEFAFLFRSEVSDVQATEMLQRIAGLLSAKYVVYNIAVSITVSGCFYRYHAGECNSVNSMLSKMDSVMHIARDNGGNTILEVNS